MEQNENVKIIIEAVSGYYKVKVADLLSRKRSQDVVNPRRMAIYLLKNIAKCSSMEISKIFGKDLMSVNNTCDYVTELLERDENVKNDMKLLRERISSMSGIIPAS